MSIDLNKLPDSLCRCMFDYPSNNAHRFREELKKLDTVSADNNISFKEAKKHGVSNSEYDEAIVLYNKYTEIVDGLTREHSAAIAYIDEIEVDINGESVSARVGIEKLEDSIRVLLKMPTPKE